MGQGFESLQAYQTAGISHNMVGVAQLVRASDCGSEGRGFESLYPPHKATGPEPAAPALVFSARIQGCSQVVRQGTLTPSSAGSSPAIPARPPQAAPLFNQRDPLAQLVEQLPFKPWVRGSSPRRVTTPEQAAFRLLRRFFKTEDMKTLRYNRRVYYAAF